MSILPTRTSADTNSSADINELSTEALDKNGTSELAGLTEMVNNKKDDLILVERASDGLLRKQKKSSLRPSGVIKEISSVINDSTLATITDWTTTTGAHESTITLNEPLAYTYVANAVFFRNVGSDEVQVYPSEVRLLSSSSFKVTDVVDTNLKISLVL